MIGPGAIWQHGAGRDWWRRLALASLICACAACAFLPFDWWVARNVQKEKLPRDLERGFQLLEIFGHGTGILLAALAIALVRRDLWREALRMLVATGLSAVLVNGIKLFVWRYRPGHFLPVIDAGDRSWSAMADAAQTGGGFRLNWSEQSMQSFPSGHSANAVMLAVFLSTLFPGGRTLFWALAAAACLQRILSHAHWPSDVFSGALVGLAATAIAVAMPLPGGSSAKNAD